MTRRSLLRIGLSVACLFLSGAGCQWGVHPFQGSSSRDKVQSTAPSGEEALPENDEPDDVMTNPNAPSGATGGAGTTTGGVAAGTAGTSGSSGTTATGTTGTTGTIGTTGTAGSAGTSGGTSGTTGGMTSGTGGTGETSGTSGTSGTAMTPATMTPGTGMTPATMTPVTATPATMWACYQFVYASAKEGADNIYLRTNCGASWPEYKLTNNADAGITYRNLTLRPDVGMVSADVETGSGPLRRITGFEAWDIHRLDALSRIDVRYDVNNDGNPDFDQVHSLTWDGTGGFVSFLGRDIAANKPIARIQLGFLMNPTGYIDPVYVPVVVPNAANTYSFERLLWFSRNYPDPGYDMLVLSASKGAGQPVRIYSRDLNVRTSDDLSEVVSTDEPSKSQTKPAISRDGTKLAFVKLNDANQPSIWTTTLTIVDKDVDGHNVTPRHIVANGAAKLADGDSPCWTHDGEALMFEKDGKFYLMKADGSASTEISFAAGVNPHSLACSPKLPMLWAATPSYSVTVQPAQQRRETVYQRPLEILPYAQPAGTGGTTGGTAGTTTP